MKIKSKIVTGLIIAAIVTTLILVLVSATTLKTGQVGLVIRYGKIQEEKLHSGPIHFRNIFTDKVVKINTKTQERLIDVGDELTDPIKGITQDRVSFFGNRLSVSFDINPATVEEIYLITESGDPQHIVRIQDLSEAFQKAVSNKKSSEIFGGSSVSDEMKVFLQAEVDERFGTDRVTIRKMTIGEATFSAEYNAALSQKATAQVQQDQARINNQTTLEAIEADAIRNVVQAESEKQLAQIQSDIAIIEATAIAEANRVIAQSVTSELVDYLVAEARKEHGWVIANGGTTIVDATEKE